MLIEQINDDDDDERAQQVLRYRDMRAVRRTHRLYIHLYSPYMVERNKQTYIYKQINKTHRK